jgi:hypothetical protein
VLNLYGGAIKRSDARLMAENIAGVIENEFAFAQPSLAYGQSGEPGAAQITANGDAGDVLAFRSAYGVTMVTSGAYGGAAGYLYLSRNDGDAAYQPYFDKKYYGGSTVDIAFERDSGDYNLFVITIAVKDGGDTIFTLERAMKPLAFR